MRKKLQATCVAAGMAILFAGCASQDAPTEQEVVNEPNNIEGTSATDAGGTTEGDTKTSVTISSVLQNIPKFSGELDFDYVYETDAQAEIGIHATCAYTKDGRYYMKAMENSGANILYFYDNASGNTVPVCSKSNCAHNTEGCDAYFSEEHYSLYPSFWYYENSLYFPMMEGDYLYFEKISLDGSTREKAGTILRWEEKVTVNADGSESIDLTFPIGQLHRGYIYFTNYSFGEQTVVLYRSKLGSSDTAEAIFTLEGNNPGILNIKPYGRYVLFQMCNFSNDYLDYEGGTYAYDTETGAISLIGEDIMGDYIIINNCMYYDDQKNRIHCKNLKSGEENLLFEGMELKEYYTSSLLTKENGFIYLITDDVGNVSEEIVFDLDGTEQERLDFSEDDLPLINSKAIQPYSFVAEK